MDSELVMFVDNGKRLSIPCSTLEDDGKLLAHLHMFYNLIRAGGGLFELFGAKLSQKIDVVEVRRLLCSCYVMHMYTDERYLASTGSLSWTHSRITSTAG